MLRFIHTADLHIDSPLKGLDVYPGAPVERIRHATRRSFENLVNLAIDQRVQFVVIAGDLFDGEWKIVESRMWVIEQFVRLRDAGIQVVTMLGNHDAANSIGGLLPWPDNVQEFSSEAPHSIVFDNLAVALHGQSYPRPNVLEDMTPAYPAAIPGLTNIGVLHTSLAGHPQHDSYAPTSVDQLLSLGYDYWALGHIHTRDVIRANRPAIIFPGNPQGRHIREAGAKGCYLIEIRDGETTAEFHSTDVMRWELMEIALTAESDMDELFDSVHAQLRAAANRAADRFLALRLQISGNCKAHDQLDSIDARDAAMARIRKLGMEMSDRIWIEKVRLDTAPALDWSELRRGNDLFAQLLRTIDEIAGSDQQLKLMAADLEGLSRKAGSDLQQAGIRFDDPDELRRWLRNAESLLFPLIAKTKQDS